MPSRHDSLVTRAEWKGKGNAGAACSAYLNQAKHFQDKMLTPCKVFMDHRRYWSEFIQVPSSSTESLSFVELVMVSFRVHCHFPVFGVNSRKVGKKRVVFINRIKKKKFWFSKSFPLYLLNYHSCNEISNILDDRSSSTVDGAKLSSTCRKIFR